jgi:hypothetical protein
MEISDIDLVRAMLARDGYAHLTGLGTVEQFNQVCESLGSIVATRSVKLDPQRTEPLNNSPALALHTDHPDANYVAWYCHANMPIGGESLLCDGHRALARMHPSYVTFLPKILVRYMSLEDGARNVRPLLRNDRGRNVLCYAPWLIEEPKVIELYRVLRAFETAIRDELLDNMLSINLKASDALFVDNFRFLHGRRTLPDPSPRHFSRRWIHVPVAADA